MERLNWVKKTTINKTTVHRAPAATWAPIRTESLSMIIGDQTPHKVEVEIVRELWATRGDRQTLGGFIKEIRTQEGLI